MSQIVIAVGFDQQNNPTNLYTGQDTAAARGRSSFRGTSRLDQSWLRLRTSPQRSCGHSTLPGSHTRLLKVMPAETLEVTVTEPPLFLFCLAWPLSPQ
jgi:hypothetical protein